MNRLVIIGNGFDLAHGLPTSYGHFIDDFWKNFKDKCKSDEYQKLILTNDAYNGYYLGYKSIENFNDLKSNLSEYCHEYNYDFYNVDVRASTKPVARFQNIFSFKNNFFRSINQKSIENWIDIENEYYRELKKIVKSTSINIEEKKQKVIVLNKEFEKVKNLLENYLSKIFDAIYDFDNVLKLEIINHLKSNPRRSDFLLKETEKFYHQTENLKLGKTVLLSFNYTETVEDYSNYLLDNDFEIGYNYIHGKMKVKELPIIFGFGDEMDNDYIEIENIDDNEYLKYFKSIQYLEHSTYKRLYNFIEAEPFQVFIMGHSCGLSDRTLLSMIFENENCLSVKVFYHQKSKFSDNYTEIIQNISRHFKDKKMLRNKVVEKRHCEPLIKFVDKENGSHSCKPFLNLNSEI